MKIHIILKGLKVLNLQRREDKQLKTSIELVVHTQTLENKSN
jgi:hypothetical protein